MDLEGHGVWKKKILNQNDETSIFKYTLILISISSNILYFLEFYTCFRWFVNHAEIYSKIS